MCWIDMIRRVNSIPIFAYDSCGTNRYFCTEYRITRNYLIQSRKSQYIEKISILNQIIHHVLGILRVINHSVSSSSKIVFASFLHTNSSHIQRKNIMKKANHNFETLINDLTKI